MTRHQHLSRNSGRYQWDARVQGTRPGEGRRIIRITVFCDDRSEAVRAAVQEVKDLGFESCTVNHIAKVG